MPQQTTKTVTLRSRSANYRWRHVQFQNHTAEVDEATAERAARDPFFGQGRDFWLDQSAAAAPAGGGKNKAPAPEPLDAAKLAKLNKEALIELATQRDIAVSPDATKANIIELLTAA